MSDTNEIVSLEVDWDDSSHQVNNVEFLETVVDKQYPEMPQE
jgi:hypothetical protein